MTPTPSPTLPPPLAKQTTLYVGRFTSGPLYLADIYYINGNGAAVSEHYEFRATNPGDPVDGYTYYGLINGIPYYRKNEPLCMSIMLEKGSGNVHWEIGDTVCSNLSFVSKLTYFCCTLMGYPPKYWRAEYNYVDPMGRLIFNHNVEMSPPPANIGDPVEGFTYLGYISGFPWYMKNDPVCVMTNTVQMSSGYWNHGHWIVSDDSCSG